MARSKGFSTFDVLFASILLMAAFVLASSALSSRVSSIAFFDSLSKSEENALIASEMLVKTCGGIARCQDGVVVPNVIELRRANFSYAVYSTGGEVFSQLSGSRFCVTRLALLEGELVGVKICA